MPIPGIISTARALGFYLKLQEVTANNLANANTDAFKADRLSAHLLAGSEHAVPVQTTDLRQGPIRETGRPLDVALDGPGFLVVRTPQGDRLTRGGSLRLDSAGRLTDAHGNPLLGTQGPVVLQGSEIDIQPDGTMVVDGAVAGRLRLENVDDPSVLLKEEAGRFLPHQPPHAVEDGSVRIRQRSVEDANLDPVLSMVDLVSIQRAYSANIDAMRALDGVLGTITNEVGKA